MLSASQTAFAQKDDLYFDPQTDQDVFYPIAYVESKNNQKNDQADQSAQEEEDGNYSYSSRIRRFHNRNTNRFGYDSYAYDPYSSGGYDNFSYGMMMPYSNSFWNSYSWNRHNY